MRSIIVGLLAVGVALGGWAAAQDSTPDEPPLRLKKKNRPAEEPKAEAPKEPKEPKANEEPAKPAPPPRPDKPDQPKDNDREQLKPKGGPEGPEATEPEVDEQEVLNRIGKNMRTSEDRLANRELTDGTRQVQEDIVKDIDSLLNQMQNGGGGGGDDQQNQNQDQQQQQQGGGQQARNRQQQGGGQQQRPGMASRRGGRGQQQRQQASRRQRGQGQGQGQDQQTAGKPQGQGQRPDQQAANGTNPQGGGRSEGDVNKLSEIYKDVWGHLPETLRAEMNAYSKEQFMARYNDLIRQYYSTIAEKGRRKE